MAFVDADDLIATPPGGGGAGAALVLKWPPDAEPLGDPKSPPVRAAAGFDGGCETPPPLDPELELDELEEPDEPEDPDEPDELPVERGIACPLASAGTASPATIANAAK